MIRTLRDPTRLLKCAAYKYLRDIGSAIEERSEHPFKADAPEIGIDLDAIASEYRRAKRLDYLRCGCIGAVALLTLLLFLSSEFGDGPLFFGYLVLVTIEFGYARARKSRIRRILGENESADELRGPWQSERTKNNVVISGGYGPFLGAGNEIDSWSFLVDLSEPENAARPVIEVEPKILHEKIRRRFGALALPGLTIFDKVFVHGADVNFLPHLRRLGRYAKPIQLLNDDYIKSILGNTDERERHYRVIHIPVWNNQMALSMYYRFVRMKTNLFVEAQFFLLPPIREKFRKLAELPLVPSMSEYFNDFSRSLAWATVSWAGVLFRAAVYISGGFLSDVFKQGRLQKEVESTRMYNYGWKNSLREQWASDSYERYFQMMDRNFSQKTLTSEFLSCLQEHLKSCNVSVAQFQKASTKIINEGILISGGEVKADSLAIGRGANVKK